MYGKLNDGNLMIAPSKLSGNGVVVYNPPAEMYEDNGWKKVIFTDPPVCEEGYHAEYSWRETAKQIRQDWTVVQDPPEEAGEQDFIEALEDLGVNLNDES